MEPRGWNPLPLSGRVAAAPELGVLPLGLSLRPTIGAAAFPSSKIFWPRPLTRMADAVRPLPRRGERGRGRCPYITSPFGGEVVDAQRRVRGLGRLVTDHPLEGLVRRLGSGAGQVGVAGLGGWPHAHGHLYQIARLQRRCFRGGERRDGPRLLADNGVD